MLTNGPNIYQAARKESCLTQEQAAERLEVSETTVKAWEQGQRVPDNETVARMSELYENAVAGTGAPETGGRRPGRAAGGERAEPSDGGNYADQPGAGLCGAPPGPAAASHRGGRHHRRERAPGLRRHMPGPGRHRGRGAAGEVHVERAAEGKKRTPRGWHLRAFGSRTCIQER